MKKILQTLILLLAVLMPTIASAEYQQLAQGVYQDGSTLYIGSGVTSLGDLQVNPSEIYCYATIPPACVSNTFLGYDATIHVPAAGMVSYFTALYWCNFNSILSDAIEPLSVTINNTEAEMEIGQQLSLSATVAPGDATPKTVYWSSTDPSIAKVIRGTVTALAAGECDILATCVDKVAVCHVTVVSPCVTIALDKHEVYLLPNHTITLAATCTPINVDLAVTSSNPGVAIPRLVNGTIMVVGVSEGTATITANTVNGNCNPDSCVVTVYTETGDVNCDGYVNISDVTKLIDYLLSGNPEGLSVDNADTSRDGQVNISDVTTLIDYLLSGRWQWEGLFTVNGVTFKMVRVEGGTFTMGSNAQDYEMPAHKVTLSSYLIGETEVTQELWQAVMGNNPSFFAADLQNPVENVSWNDCQTFITKLNQITGKKFRLPSEAEWEYAARGGKKSKDYIYAGSNTINEVAWYKDNSNSTTHSVASKKANELGIYDMSGNVNEWCQDWDSSYSNEEQSNPTGPTSGYYRMDRGGSFDLSAGNCRVTSRHYGEQMGSINRIGLRLALDVENTNKFRLSETVITVLKNNSATVNILNGSGSYVIAGGEDYVTTIIDGNRLILTGKAVGTTTVHITDNITGESTILTVIINSNEEVFTVNGVTFKMLKVEGGTFTMGGTEEQGSDAYSNEYPTHEVTLSSFSIGETEVTQALWVAVMGSNPSGFTGDLQCPVENVSWNKCQEFIEQLNYKLSLSAAARKFRLPTEAQWEYAARGGNNNEGCKYSGSNSINAVAWYSSNASNKTHPVAKKAPNKLGLYDMSGNVFEWCQNRYYPYTSDGQTTPYGNGGPIMRGGSWNLSSSYCRVSCRSYVSSYSTAYTHTGLRLVY